MPNMTSITVNDGEATPVAHIFVPKGIDGKGVARFRASTGVPIADENLAISLRESSGKVRPRISLAVPVVVTETINGVDEPKIDRAGFGDCSFTFSAKSTKAERRNVRILMANAILHANLESVVDDVENHY